MKPFAKRLGALSLGLCVAAPGAHSATQTSPADTFTDSIREEVIVTATRIPMPAKNIGSTVSVLTADDIEARKVQLTSDLLREVPGVAVSRAGQVGAVTQVRMRGAEGNHTLVLIDGIEANNPALGFEFNFADLMTYDIERVEVLRGPQSALYGSEAIGGVISISTPSPADGGLSARAEAQGGSHDTSRLGGSLLAGSERAYASLSAMRFDTNGISSSAIQPERDGYETTTLHGKAYFAVTDQFSLKAVVRHADNEVEIDVQDFAFPSTPTQGLIVDSNDRTESSQLYALLQADLALLDDRLLNTLRYSYVDSESKAYAGDVFDNGNEGERRKLDIQSSYLFPGNGLNQAVTVGVQYEELEFNNRFPFFAGATYDARDDQMSYIAEYNMTTAQGLAVSASARHDDNDRFDDATSWRLAGSYLLADTGTRLHASVGKGITNPSFFELFGFSPSSFIGNPDLKPEESRSFDVGIEQALFGGRGLVDVTYFDSNLQDEITTVFDPFTFLSTAENLDGESDRKGVEVSGQFAWRDVWQARLSYTWLDATEPDGDVEVRRPEHTASVNVNRSFLGGRGNANLGVVYSGSQEDSEFIFATPADRVNLDSYTLVGLALSYDVTAHVQIFARADNLLDDGYTEVFGYRSVGRTGSLGVRAGF